MSLLIKQFFSPDDSITTLPEGKEDTIKFLGMEDKEDEKEQVIPLDTKKPIEKEEKVVEKESEETEEDDEEVDELKEIEESLDEDEVPEEALELVGAVSRKEILKKYPNLFKDFPYLESAYYRNYQFTDLFPTPKDAEQALAKADTLDAFDKDLLSGNTKNILEAAKKSDPKAFYKIVDTYMSTLADVDEKAYHHVLGNNIKQTIVAMVREGRRSDDESLVNAAALLNKFVFGSSEFEPAKNLSTDEKVDNSKENELKEREQKIVLQQLDKANTDLSRVVQNSLKATIAANIDPKSSMSEFVKKHASNEVLEAIETSLQSDKQFQTLIDRLWERALENDFSKEATDKIRNAFFAKAKMLLPSAIKKARIEALKGMGKRVKEEKIEEDTTEESGDDQPERKRSNTSSKKIGEIPKGMSTLDYLLKD